GTYEHGTLAEPVYVSPLKSGPGGGINLDEIRQIVQPLIKEQSDIGNATGAQAIRSIMDEIAPGERVVSNQRGFDLLTKLDAEVNRAYTTLDQNTIPPGTEARKAIANELRIKLRQNVPEISDLLSQNHSLQMFDQSILPQVSGRPF